jgi:hypothetical protein
MNSRPQIAPPGLRAAAPFLLPIFLLCLPVCAQQPNLRSGSAATGQNSPASEKNKSDEGQDPTNKEQSNSPTNDRIFYAMPNYLTVENASQTPPVSAGRKFKLVAEDTFDYFNYPWYAFLAGLSQAENSEPGYGQGAKGYGKRYAATFADGTIENFTTGAVFPALLHQDPRYFQLGKGSFFHRSGYALSRIFITRADSGHSQFNYSEIAGAAVAAGIANAYHPAGDRNFANTMSIWGTDMGWDAFTFFVKEFWPDLKRKLHTVKN